MYVRNLIFIFTFLTSTFAYTSFVQADGDHSSHSNISNAITNFQGSEQSQSSGGTSHSGMDHNAMNDSTTDHSTMDHSNMDHSTTTTGQHSGHSGIEMEQTQPNYKVLGTFGAINLGFLSVGAILKIKKRKEKIYEVK